MWGYYDPYENNYKSYIEKYANLSAVPGIKGCDYLIGSFANYFGDYVKHLIKEYGY